MAWTVTLIDDPNRPDVTDPDYQPPPLGSVDEVHETLRGVWPDLMWSAEPALWMLERGDCVLRVSLRTGDEGLVRSVVLEPGFATGHDPYPAIHSLVQTTGWAAWDSVTADFWGDVVRPVGLGTMRREAGRVQGRPRVKICCISSQAEVDLAVAAGADWLGFVDAETLGGTGVLPIEGITELVPTVPDGVDTVLLTGAQSPETIIDQARATGVPWLQLVRPVDPEDYPALREALPNVGLVQVLHVEGPEDLDVLRAHPADQLLLDSADPETGALGATGRVHDWDVSREIVAALDTPVWLAGGLKADNVGRGIATVDPWGLDLCTGVRDEEGKLDRDRLTAFFRAIEAEMLRVREPEIL